uniref:Uncharacterized protein n=1 Tax=Chromera velia CCMP2878 TaxID=1169474 RepID=A0A0G4H8I6_9ALVE|eukprot:Cvel_25123.t1-p1 / transcript=Cvel_25123.t1 / gene=Cvel_25123 / organism=Chromera_velia_CCMP2878 / gene_product=hypothetical protein / transcript_product=hypothetical protein / location=Cvel_scaffold2805:14558-15274(-) / protein_length=239 / sequence_SO=supercontig / SO=protein_coding / is_pseudo=false
MVLTQTEPNVDCCSSVKKGSDPIVLVLNGGDKFSLDPLLLQSADPASFTGMIPFMRRNASNEVEIKRDPKLFPWVLESISGTLASSTLLHTAATLTQAEMGAVLDELDFYDLPLGREVFATEILRNRLASVGMWDEKEKRILPKHSSEIGDLEIDILSAFLAINLPSNQFVTQALASERLDPLLDDSGIESADAVDMLEERGYLLRSGEKGQAEAKFVRAPSRGRAIFPQLTLKTVYGS